MLDKFYLNRARHVFYTYRDIRVAAISSMRKFNLTPDISMFRSQIEQYKIAKVCNNLIKYEDLIINPEKIIKKIANVLDVQINPSDVGNKALNLKPEEEVTDAYSKRTLLHKNHFTNTKDNEWRDLLSEDLKNQINNEFSWWFKECGYPEK